jgi:hypothetical protein
MNTVDEIKTFLNTINCGEAIFTVDIGVDFRHGDSLSVYLKHWPEKEELMDSSNIVEKWIGKAIQRKFEKETRLLVPDRKYYAHII